MFEAIIDVILIGKEQEQAKAHNIFTNDIDAVGAKVVSLCGARKLADDGGFWQKGSAGGHFWVSPDGDAWFFPGSDFADLEGDASRETFCVYESKNADGKMAKNYLLAKVYADTSDIPAEAKRGS